MSQHRSKNPRGRQRVASSDVFVGTRVHAPLDVRAPDNRAAQTADALVAALGVGSTLASSIISRKREKSFLAGTAAALEGREPTSEELASDGFTLGQQKIFAERDLVQFKADARALYQNSTNKGNMLLLNEELEALYLKSYEGLDVEIDTERALVEQIIPEIRDIFTEIHSMAQRDSDLALRQDIESSAQVKAEDIYNETGVFDPISLNNALMIAGVGGPRTNKIVSAVARQIAEENKDPEVINALLAIETWPGTGAAAPANIIELREGLRHSRTAAAAGAKQAEGIRHAEDVREHAEFMDSSQIELMQLIIGGDATSVPAKLLKLMLSEGSFDGTAASTWINIAKGYDANALIEDKQVDWDKVAELDYLALKGELPVSSLVDQLKYFGTGRDQAEILERLTRNQRSATTAKRTDPTYTVRQNELTALYTATATLEDRWPGIAVHRAEAHRAWSDLQFNPSAVEGYNNEPALTPAQALKWILNKDGKLDHDLKPRPQEEWLELASKSFGGTSGILIEVTAAVQEWRDNKMPTAVFFSQRPEQFDNNRAWTNYLAELDPPQWTREDGRRAADEGVYK